ncbi:ferritin [Desulfonatronospira sp.]|uniref:ferritin n=1 Tax=Desulfonatronospira sp. TaxID=1962951 RepID=UPI0025BEF71A|nr:ferritin [Desulfonatronospira sp.]
MFSEKMQQAMNQQVNAEMYSSYLYLSMAGYFEGKNLPGCARWMRMQAQEELMHAMKIHDFIHERGGKVKLTAIEEPPGNWESPQAVFENVLSHEQKVTGLINDLVDLAIQEKDHASNIFLQWFVTEQVEEEASADGVLQKIRLTAEAPGGLFVIDQELGQRTMACPCGQGRV